MTKIEKITIGALGGLCAVLVKFLGQDYTYVVEQAHNFTQDQLFCYKVGYGILTPILMFLGAFVAWISEETKRIKIVALAIAAPAMITTWSGGSKSDKTPLMPVGIFISTTYAQTEIPDTTLRVYLNEEKQEESNFEIIKKGIGTFFGYDKEPKRYFVIIGSYKNIDMAHQFADKVRFEDGTLHVWVGKKIYPNEYYPVIVGQYCFLNEANKLKERVLRLETVHDAYLSLEPER